MADKVIEGLARKVTDEEIALDLLVITTLRGYARNFAELPIQFRTETDGYARMFINDMFDSKEQRDIYWDKYECFKLDEDW